MIAINIRDFRLNQIVSLSQQILIDATLRLDFLADCHRVINFAERIIALKINGGCTKGGVFCVKGTKNKVGGVEEATRKYRRGIKEL